MKNTIPNISKEAQKKGRLDQLLVEKHDVESIEKARMLIMSGRVLVNDQKMIKAGDQVRPDVAIRILGTELPYVSRGGEKLAGAFKAFDIAIQGRVCMDVGLSTGGFSDYLFQQGAAFIFGVDVGYGQVDLKVRNNPNLCLLERTNARALTHAVLEKGCQKMSLEQDNCAQISLVVMDVSFISVTKLLPVIQPLVMPNTDYVILIKPQFEAEKDQVEQGGIVRDTRVRASILDTVAKTLECHFEIVDQTQSPITGAKGNIEYFFWLKNKVKA